jgi:predicted acetyltransferase
MALVWPALEYLDSYLDALTRGFAHDNVRGLAATMEEIEAIHRDPQSFVESLVDPEGKGSPITLPNGMVIKRLPGYRRWMWDGEFAGSIGFRWQPGTAELPSYVLGHIGYSVPEWKQGRGYATDALRQLLPDAKARGLPYVELTTDPDNVASQRVILKNGGVLVEEFNKGPAYHDAPGLRYRIHLRSGTRTTG